jgi:hypothetical protein
MADEISNIILEHLRHMRGKLDRVDSNVEMLTLRVGSIERILAAVYNDQTLQNVEMDRLKTRIERIERRLELSEG